MKILLAIIIGYLLGSINSAYILGRLNGIDIRTVNSHNPGAANAQLTYGWKGFFIVWICDMLKTNAAYYLCKVLFPSEPIIAVISAVATIVGHCFSCFLGFHGGKGFSCYCGLVLAFNPLLFAGSFVLTAILTFTSMSLTFITYFDLFAGPIIFLCFKQPLYSIIALAVSSIIVGVKHKPLWDSFFRNEGLSIDKKKDGIRYVFKRHRDEA